MKLDEIKRETVLELYAILRGKKFPKLDVVLHTPGGDADATFLITKLLHAHSDHVAIIVPYYAKSAGTILCLGADELVVSELSELGPLDVQIREQQEGHGPKFTSALNGFKALEQVQIHTIQTLDLATKMILQRTGMRFSDALHLAAEFAGQTSGTLYAQLDPKRIGEYARALGIGERYGILILTRFMNWPLEKAKQTVLRLIQDYPSHDFVIDYSELLDLGLPAVLADPAVANVLEDACKAFFQHSGSKMKLYETPIATPSPGTGAVQP